MALVTYECAQLDVSSASGASRTGHGVVEVTDHGRVWIEVTFSSATPPFGQAWLAEELAVAGQTTEGWLVIATRSYVETTTWDSAKQQAIVRLGSLDTVLLEQQGRTPNWTTKKLHLRNIHALWPQSWSFAGLAFDLKSMNRSSKVPERDRPGLVDYEVTIQRSGQASGNWPAVRSAVLKLLSLAARSPSSAPLEETWEGTTLVAAELLTGDSDYLATHALIPPDCLGSFMNVALPAYNANEADAGLAKLISYYCRSHTEPTAEYKFLFAGVLMEALKLNWAVNRRKLPVKRAASGVIKEFLKPDGKTRYGFEELLNMVASDLGLNAKYTFIENRNAVFHTGEAAAAQTAGAGNVWSAFQPELVKLHDEVDDLLLSHLQYTGPITSYWNMGQRLQFPGRAALP